MTLVTFTYTHWYAQKMRRYPSWTNYARAYARDYARAYALADAYARAYARTHVYTNVGRYCLTCANESPQR
jgi:hypothetical protein